MAGLSLSGGVFSHFSICNRLSACRIEMIMAIFTSPSEFASHHFASFWRCHNVLEYPDSMVIVDQSSAFFLEEGLEPESPSLQLIWPLYLVAATDLTSCDTPICKTLA